MKTEYRLVWSRTIDDAQDGDIDHHTCRWKRLKKLADADIVMDQLNGLTGREYHSNHEGFTGELIAPVDWFKIQMRQVTDWDTIKEVTNEQKVQEDKETEL